MPKYRRALWCVPHGSYLKPPSHFDAAWQGFITCSAGQMSWHELLLNLQFSRWDFLQRFWQFAATKKLLEALSTWPALIKKMAFMVVFKIETPLCQMNTGHFTHANIITTGRKLCTTWNQSGKGGTLHGRSIKLHRGLTLWDRNKPLIHEGPMLLRENQQEMGHLIARDSPSACFGKERKSWPPLHYSSVK